jgi:hypothetical protein
MALKAREITKFHRLNARLRGQEWRALLGSAAWKSLESRNVPFACLIDFAQNECGMTLNTQ